MTNDYWHFALRDSLANARGIAEYLGLNELAADIQRISSAAPKPSTEPKQKQDEPTGVPLYGLAAKD